MLADGAVPTVDVKGAVEKPVTWSAADLRKLLLSISHLLLPSTSLTCQNRTHKTRVYLTSWKGWFVTENENIEGIAVLAARLREETEIIWEYHPFRHDLRQLHPSSPFVELVFIEAAPRCFDDDLHRS